MAHGNSQQQRILVPVAANDQVQIVETTTIGQNVNLTFGTQTAEVFICAEFPYCDVRGCGSEHIAPIDCGPEYCDRPRTIGVFVGMFVLSLIIVAANLLIIRVVMSSPSLRRRHGYIKVSMATSDLLVGFFVIPSAMFNMGRLLFSPPHQAVNKSANFTPVSTAFDNRLYQANQPQSIIFGTINVVAIISSIYNLLLFSIDRFMAIARPLRQKTGRNFKKTSLYLWIFAAWFVGIWVSVIPILFSKNFSYSSNPTTFIYVQELTSSENGMPGQWAAAYVALILVLPYSLTVLLNILTMLVTWKRLQRRAIPVIKTPKQSHGKTKNKCLKKNKKSEEEEAFKTSTPGMMGKAKQKDELSAENGSVDWVTMWKSEDNDVIHMNNNHSDDSDGTPHYQRTRDKVTVIRANPFTEQQMEQWGRFKIQYSYHIRVLKSILSMVVAFTICIIPYVSVAVAMSTGKLTCGDVAIPFTFALYMLFANSIMNFFIYNYWQIDFRKQMKCLLLPSGKQRQRNSRFRGRSATSSRSRTNTLSTVFSGFRSSFVNRTKPGQTHT